jgi:hypothetical protein
MLTYLLDQGQMPASAVVLLPSNLPDVSRLCASLRAMGGLALRRWLSAVLAVGVLLLLVRSVCAETDALMHAAGFAVTGSIDVDTKVIGDPAECVFGIKNDLFRWNNVYTDLIKIEAHQRQRLGVVEQWVTVTLQGEGVVFETTVEPPQDDGSELVRQMRMQSPELFRPHHYTYTQYELCLTTKDQDAVKRAWQAGALVPEFGALACDGNFAAS